VKKILITGPKKLLHQLENKLRRNFEIELFFEDNTICKIETKKNKQLIVICSFSSDEKINNILTMFEVNYQMKIGQKRLRI
jgi:hypothetical protein